MKELHLDVEPSSLEEASIDVSQNAQVDFVRSLSSSKFNYWAGYAANSSLVAWLLSRAWGALTLSEWLFSFAFGLVLWTLAEYVLHRYAYHEIHSMLKIGHDIHHDEPKALLGVPWYLTAVVLVGTYFGLSYFFNPARLGVVMGSLWLGYIGYCLAHHAMHHWHFKNAYFKNLRKHHLIHHHAGDKNWGITTDVWDKLFRTKA